MGWGGTQDSSNVYTFLISVSISVSLMETELKCKKKKKDGDTGISVLSKVDGMWVEERKKPPPLSPSGRGNGAMGIT